MAYSQGESHTDFLKTSLQQRGNWRASLGAAMLLVVFLLPAALALLGGNTVAEANLPACCRAHGKHKCSMGGGSSRTGSERTTVSYLHEKCPCTLGTAPASITPFLQGTLLTLQLHQSVGTLASSWLPSAPHRNQTDSNPKRGPPVFFA